VLLLRTVLLLDRSIISLCDDLCFLKPGTVVLSSLCGVRVSFNEAVVARTLGAAGVFGRFFLCEALRARQEGERKQQA